MRRYKLVCNVGVGDVLAQTIVWFLLSLITFGLALPFFAYAFVRLFISKTEIVEISSGAEIRTGGQGISVRA